MEDTTLRMVYIFTDIILPMIAGYVAKRRSWLTPDQSNWLIRFNIIVIMTSLTLLSFWVLPMRTDLLSLPFFAFFNGLLPLAVVLLLGRQRKFSSFVDRGSYLIAAIPANTGMLGGLCSYILYGEMSYAYVQIIGVFQNLLMFFALFLKLVHETDFLSVFLINRFMQGLDVSACIQCHDQFFLLDSQTL